MERGTDINVGGKVREEWDHFLYPKFYELDVLAEEESRQKMLSIFEEARPDPAIRPRLGEIGMIGSGGDAFACARALHMFKNPINNIMIKEEEQIKESGEMDMRGPAFKAWIESIEEGSEEHDKLYLTEENVKDAIAYEEKKAEVAVKKQADFRPRKFRRGIKQRNRMNHLQPKKKRK